MSNDEHIEKHKARVIEVAKPDIVTTEDGYQCFWPTTNKGFYSAVDLRIIADELDRLNADWDKEVQDYFSKGVAE